MQGFHRTLTATLMAVIGGGFASPAQVSAQAAVSAAAEVLFRDGKRLFEQGDYRQACPKLAESYRIEAATGTLIALALCHRSEGKSATAWAEFSLATGRARREGRVDREQAASTWAAELEPKLSTLTIVLAESAAKLPGLVVKRDGVVVGNAGLNMAVPVDPGEHSVEVTAAGKKPWTKVLRVRADGDRQTAAVPMLEDTRVDNSPGRQAGRSLSPLQWSGVVAAGVGVVGLGVGTFFGLEAIHKNQESQDGCVGNQCSPEAKQIRLDARTDGNLSTAAFIAGGALIAGGAIMYWVGARAGASTGRVQVVPILGKNDLGMVLDASF